ncbi:MAG: hypothetical protein RIQ79_2505 [Verrucomicrobiota bacterium]
MFQIGFRKGHDGWVRVRSNRSPAAASFLRQLSYLAACFFLLAAPLRAITVNFIQDSRDDATGSLIGAVSSSQYLDTGLSYGTVTAPADYDTYRFTHWTNSSYPATVYRDVWGRSFNPISFVLLEATTATAHYLPASRDTDADGVPDWYELEYYGTLTNTAASDTDGDGVTLLQEYQNGTHPLFANTATAGGVSSSDSALVTANLAGYAAYTLRSVPAGTIAQSGYAPPGTVITSTDLAGDPAFGYWTLDGVRQQDAWGHAFTKVSFAMATTNREAVAYLFTGDTDGDGLPDAWEQQYLGSLAYAGSADLNADGFTLLQDYEAGRAPTFAYTSSPGGVAWNDSASVTVNLAGFSRYTFRSEPAGVVNQSAVVPTGTTVTSPNLTDPTFGYWSIDGQSQRDAWGVALSQVSLTITNTNREAVARFFTGDTDGDGLPDAWEYRHLGTLGYTAASDPDNNGSTLLADYQAGRSPVFTYTSGPGGVAWADSALLAANLQPYEHLDRIPVNGLLTDFFSQNAGSVTGLGTSTNSSVAVLDWNGDGTGDLFIAHAGGLRVFQNTGARTNPDFSEITTGFSGLATYLASLGRPVLAGGDFNGDGRADLVIGGNTSTLRLIASSGAFSSGAAGLDLATGSSLSLPALGDLNADGRPDLLVLLADGSSRVYLNTGTAPWFVTPQAGNPLGQLVPNPTGAGIADLDQDGRPDVVVADANGRLWEFHGIAGGGFDLRSKVWGGTEAGFASGLTVALYDWEEDGDVDFFGGLANGGIIALRDPRMGRPTGLTAVAGANSVRLNWQPGWQSRIKGYYVYRDTNAAGAWPGLTADIVPLPTYLDTNVVSGLDYTYRVTGVSYYFLPGNSAARIVESAPSASTGVVTAGRVGLSLRSVHGYPNQEVRVPLSIDNAMGLRGAGLQIRINYDPAVLTPTTQLTPGRATVLLTGLTRDLVLTDNATTASGQLVINGVSGDISAGAGKFITLRFRVKNSALLHQSSTLSVASATLYTTDGLLVTVDLGAAVALELESTYFPGDVNGDGLLTEADSTLLQQLVKPKSRAATADELKAGDLNADGKLGQPDAVLLKRLLEGLPIDEQD